MPLLAGNSSLKRRASVLGVVALLALAVLGVTRFVRGRKTMPAYLATMVASGRARLVRRFDTSKGGLVGYLMASHGQFRIFYAEDGYVFAGLLVGPGGANLSARYADEYIPKADVRKFIGKMRHTSHEIVEGKRGAASLYVFADPNCMFCHRMYEEVEPLVKAGKLRVHWIMVGFLKGTSIGRAAAILDARNPLKALRADENGFDVLRERGGIAPLKHPPAATVATLRFNFEVMAQAGGHGTPTVFYRTNDPNWPGGWAAMPGLPLDSWVRAYARHGEYVVRDHRQISSAHAS